MKLYYLKNLKHSLYLLFIQNENKKQKTKTKTKTKNKQKQKQKQIIQNKKQMLKTTSNRFKVGILFKQTNKIKQNKTKQKQIK